MTAPERNNCNVMVTGSGSLEPDRAHASRSGALANLGRTAKKGITRLSPTQLFCTEFQGVFDFFNQCLFDTELPQCMLTMDMACRSAYGYFRPDSFTTVDRQVIDQISMNPAYLISRPMVEVVSTVAHEMVHLWKHRCSGKPVTSGYHCRGWGRKMEEIGLMPSNTGAPGGKKTGYQMTHYPIPGGKFLGAVAVLRKHGFEITWGRVTGELQRRGQAGTGASKGKVKFQCPQCRQSAWGAPTLELICGKDRHRMLRALP